jgi:Flp pilus assembly protein TadD
MLAEKSKSGLRTGLGGALIAAITAFAFYPTLHGAVSYADADQLAVGASATGTDGCYQPLTRASFLLDQALWGSRASGYHAFNLALHILNSLLVYLLGLALIAAVKARAPRKRLRLGDHVGAALAALLFALHPLRVEAVAWVSQRAVLLSVLWLLLSVWLYVRGMGRIGWLLGSLGCYMLSLAAGPLGVALPVVLVLLDWYPLRRLGARAGIWLEKIPFVLLAVVAGVLGLRAQPAGPGIVERSALTAYGSVFYAWKTIWPQDLLPLYELPAPLRLLSLEYMGAIALVLGALAIVLWYARQAPGLAVATINYVVLLLPAVFLMQSDYEAATDRYSYLPSIVWALLAAGGFARLWTLSGLEMRLAASGVTALGVATASVLGILTWQQSQVWRTPYGLWEYAVQCGKSSGIALYRFGQLCAQAGETERAVQVWRAAIYYRPTLFGARLKLGATLLETARFEEAISAYRASAAVFPTSPEAQFQLGNALAAGGEFAEAEEHLRRAIALDPRDAAPRSAVGHLFMLTQRWGEAVEAFQAALTTAPEDAALHFDLGRAYAREGHAAKAREAFQQALALDPEYRLARRALDALTTQPSD